jgi:intraflagellar transport protein 122
MCYQVRIKCKDLVQRISLYKNKLAAMLTDRVCIYESSSEESSDMQFRLRRERISMGDKPCSLMAVTSNQLVFCREALLELYGFDGNRSRIWQLDSVIKYIKVDGGPDGSESLILGLENGVICKVFLDNPFPVELTKRQNNVSIITADMSLYRNKLAVVDSNNVLTIILLATQEVLFTCNNVFSVCFNTEVDDMLCYTGDTSISVVSALGNSLRVIDGKPLQPMPQEQHIAGLAIGFQGQKIFCVYRYVRIRCRVGHHLTVIICRRGNIIGVDVPQGGNMLRALDNSDYKGAYAVACLGATEAEWKLLAMRCLRANQVNLAKSAFARLKETKFLSLLESIEKNPHPSSIKTSAGTSSSAASADGGEKSRGGRVRGGGAATVVAPTAAGSVGGVGQPLDPVWQAEVLATEGHHHEAAKAYARAGKIDESIRLFTDLRRWNEAKLFAQSSGQPNLAAGLTAMQAKWLQEVNDWKGASELFVSMGQYMQAAKIVGDTAEPGWTDALIEVVRGTPTENTDVSFPLLVLPRQ